MISSSRQSGRRPSAAATCAPDRALRLEHSSLGLSVASPSTRYEGSAQAARGWPASVTRSRRSKFSVPSAVAQSLVSDGRAWRFWRPTRAAHRAQRVRLSALCPSIRRRSAAAAELEVLVKVQREQFTEQREPVRPAPRGLVDGRRARRGAAGAADRGRWRLPSRDCSISGFTSSLNMFERSSLSPARAG